VDASQRSIDEQSSLGLFRAKKSGVDHFHASGSCYYFREMSTVLVDFCHTLSEGLLSLFRDDTTDGTGLLKVCERHRCHHPEER
jgi:hypothetical protein